MSCTLLPIYWGADASEALNAAQVQALANSREQIRLTGVYDFGELLEEGYLWFASPAQFGRVRSFLYGDTPETLTSLNLVPIESPLTLSIDGATVPYYLYRSPDLLIGECALEIN